MRQNALATIRELVRAAFEAGPADKVWTLRMLAAHIDPKGERGHNLYLAVSKVAKAAASDAGRVAIMEEGRRLFLAPSIAAGGRFHNPEKSTLAARIADALLTRPDHAWSIAEVEEAIGIPAKRRGKYSLKNPAEQALEKIGWLRVGIDGVRVRYASPEVAATLTITRPNRSWERTNTITTEELAEKITELFYRRPDRAFTPTDLVRHLFPDNPKRQRMSQVYRAANIAVADLGWRKGKLRGLVWYASPKVAATMRAARPKRPVRPDRRLRADPVENRIARVLETCDGDEISLADLTDGAFRSMAVYRSARDAVRAKAPAVAKWLGWRTVDEGGRTMFRRGVAEDAEASPTFEEIAS